VGADHPVRWVIIINARLEVIQIIDGKYAVAAAAESNTRER
jgi:hypothetical protein